MKKIKLFLLAFFSMYAFSGVNSSYAFSVVKPAANPETVTASAFSTLTAKQFVNLSVKEFTLLTGKKLNFLQKVSFKLTKIKMKHDLKKNADLKVSDYADGTTFRIDALWLLLGLVTGPIGVLIAYLTKQESYKITSSWIGFGILVLLGGGLFLL